MWSSGSVIRPPTCPTGPFSPLLSGEAGCFSSVSLACWRSPYTVLLLPSAPGRMNLCLPNCPLGICWDVDHIGLCHLLRLPGCCQCREGWTAKAPGFAQRLARSQHPGKSENKGCACITSPLPGQPGPGTSDSFFCPFSTFQRKDTFLRSLCAV